MKKQYRRLLGELFPKIGDWNLKANIGICAYEYVGDDINGDCGMCELDECILLEHIKDKDAARHIKFIPVSVAKENTRYGAW